jgi:hypothetical protein
MLDPDPRYLSRISDPDFFFILVPDLGSRVGVKTAMDPRSGSATLVKLKAGSGSDLHHWPYAVLRFCLPQRLLSTLLNYY